MRPQQPGKNFDDVWSETGHSTPTEPQRAQPLAVVPPVKPILLDFSTISGRARVVPGGLRSKVNHMIMTPARGPRCDVRHKVTFNAGRLSVTNSYYPRMTVRPSYHDVFGRFACFKVLPCTRVARWTNGSKVKLPLHGPCARVNARSRSLGHCESRNGI